MIQWSIYSHYFPNFLQLARIRSQDIWGLLKAVMRDPNPVFYENELFYGELFPVTAECLASIFFFWVVFASNLSSYRL
jgi:pyruvate/2-oxoglutarate/acetoin dehydrogenase E1 component